MTVDNTHALPVVQMGHVEKLVEVAQNQPHVQQLVAQQTIVQELKRQDGQVAKTEKSEKSRRVGNKDVDERQGNYAGNQPQGGSRQEEAPPEEEAAASPWVGNIINVKI